MASGDAHDINNAISPVALYTESLLNRRLILASGRGYHSSADGWRSALIQCPGKPTEFVKGIGRGEWIRTTDLTVPNRARSLNLSN